MQDTEKALLELVSIGLGKKKNIASFPYQVDWPKLYKLSYEHGVSAVAVDGLQCLLKEYPNDERFVVKDANAKIQRMQWIAQSIVLEKQYRHCEDVIAELAAFYAQNDIRMMILKGYGLSFDWPNPAHRPMGDLDIYNFGKQPVADILVEKKLGIKVDDSYEHHTIFTYKGIMVENHYDFFNIYAHKSSRVLDRKLKKMVNDGCRRCKVRKSFIDLPSTQFNALFLLRHAGHHFAGERLILRQIIDWAMFVDKHYSEINWNDLIDIAKKHNIHRFLACLNAICIDYIGVDSKKFPKLPVNSSLECRIIEDVLSPEFEDKKPNDLLPVLFFKLKRWKNNIWKHRIVFNEGLFSMFMFLSWSHLKRFKTIKA